MLFLWGHKMVVAVLGSLVDTSHEAKKMDNALLACHFMHEEVLSEMSLWAPAWVPVVITESLVHALAKEGWKSKVLVCSVGTMEGSFFWPEGRLGGVM